MRSRSPIAVVAAAGLLTTFALTATPAQARPSHDAARPRPGAAAAVPADLRLVQTRTSLLGTHRFYQQTYRGIPVVGGWYARHTDQTGTAVQDGRRDVRGLDTTVASTAAHTARATARGQTRGHLTSTHLAVLPGATARLVWSVETARGQRVLVDAHSGNVVKVVSLIKQADGTGQVYDPNPVVKLQNESLTDGNNADSAVPAAAYSTVVLHRLDGSGYLHGQWATVVNKAKGNKTTQAAFSATDAFIYTRSDNRFEQANAYYAVDSQQAYIQTLGFTDVNNEPQDLSVDTTTVDNSFYTPNKDVITLGTGGVDDAEDQEVIWHEYGHAIQDDQVPGFGTTIEAGSIGEGFGDYIAVTMSQLNSPNTATTPWACVMDWDSTSYTAGTPHCLRRTDTNLTVADETGEVHDDGRIWSRALWDINRGLGRTTADKIIIESQFGFAPNTTFAAAAQHTVDTAKALSGARAASTVRSAFHARGIL
ncbi:MAG: M36 family metallopeptidase [Nocardioidaceae bacterium]